MQRLKSGSVHPFGFRIRTTCNSGPTPPLVIQRNRLQNRPWTVHPMAAMNCQLARASANVARPQVRGRRPKGRRCRQPCLNGCSATLSPTEAFGRAIRNVVRQVRVDSSQSCRRNLRQVVVFRFERRCRRHCGRLAGDEWACRVSRSGGDKGISDFVARPPHNHCGPTRRSCTDP